MNIFWYLVRNAKIWSKTQRFVSCFLKVQNYLLQVQIKAFKDSITNGTAVLNTTEANQLNTAVSQFPEYTARNRVIYGVEAHGTSDGTHNPDDRIITDKWIPNWCDLINKDRKTVMDYRKRLGIRLWKRGKGKKVGNPGENINNKNRAALKKRKYRIEG